MSDRTRRHRAAAKRRGRACRWLRWAAAGSGSRLTIVWQAILHLIDDGGMTFAGHIAFMTLFSLFPFLIFLTTLAAEIGQTEAAREFISVSLAALPRPRSAMRSGRRSTRSSPTGAPG